MTPVQLLIIYGCLLLWQPEKRGWEPRLRGVFVVLQAWLGTVSYGVFSFWQARLETVSYEVFSFWRVRLNGLD